MRQAVFGVILGLWPWSASAQDWATRAYCDVNLRPVAASDFAPHDLTELESAAADIPNGLGRFWKIETPSGNVSHLWGTYHVSAPEVLDLPTIVKDSIAAARLLALEVDYTFPDREAFLDQFNEPGRYRDASDPFAMQDPLDLGFLQSDVQTWIFDRLDGYGATEDELFVVTYGGLAALLLSDPCEDFTAGTIPVQDDFISTLGRIGGADVIGLERPDEFLTDLSEDETTAKGIVGVYASYLEPPANNDARAASFQLYLEGRLGLLAAWDEAFVTGVLGAEGAAALDLTNAYLVEFRNRRFLDRLAEPLDAGGVFVAVGAAHLPGQKGLVKLLEQTGYTLTRIPLPGEIE